jgi:hypothetical protein
VHDSDDARGSRFANGRARIIFRVSRVDDDRLAHFAGKGNLRRECRALGFAWRIVVVIIESALADRDCGTSDQVPQFWHIARGFKRGRVVGMDSGCRKHEAGIVRRRLGGHRRRCERFPDADDGPRARDAGARDYRVAVAGERLVREVGVAVDED